MVNRAQETSGNCWWTVWTEKYGFLEVDCESDIAAECSDLFFIFPSLLKKEQKGYTGLTKEKGHSGEMGLRMFRVDQSTSSIISLCQCAVASGCGADPMLLHNSFTNRDPSGVSCNMRTIWIRDELLTEKIVDNPKPAKNLWIPIGDKNLGQKYLNF